METESVNRRNLFGSSFFLFFFFLFFSTLLSPPPLDFDRAGRRRTGSDGEDTVNSEAIREYLCSPPFFSLSLPFGFADA